MHSSFGASMLDGRRWSRAFQHVLSRTWAWQQCVVACRQFADLSTHVATGVHITIVHVMQHGSCHMQHRQAVASDPRPRDHEAWSSVGQGYRLSTNFLLFVSSPTAAVAGSAFQSLQTQQQHCCCCCSWLLTSEWVHSHQTEHMRALAVACRPARMCSWRGGGGAGCRCRPARPAPGR